MPFVVHLAVPLQFPESCVWQNSSSLWGSNNMILYYCGDITKLFNIGMWQKGSLFWGSDKMVLYYLGLTKGSFTIRVGHMQLWYSVSQQPASSCDTSAGLTSSSLIIIAVSGVLHASANPIARAACGIAGGNQTPTTKITTKKTQFIKEIAVHRFWGTAPHWYIYIYIWYTDAIYIEL